VLTSHPVSETTQAPRRRRGPKRASLAHLEAAALHYLERFSSSSANLRRVLLRKVARSARAHGTDASEGERLVEDLIERYLRAGLLDDRAYAAQKAASLRRRGGSRYAIRGRLAVKGVATELIDETIAHLDEENSAGELAAACALIRRRRLGPLRAPGRRAEFRQKDLAALARAGFSLEIARRALSARDAEALAAMERGEDPRQGG
jgi:regulatory protein